MMRTSAFIFLYIIFMSFKVIASLPCLTLPPTTSKEKGNQVFHFDSSNKPYPIKSQVEKFIRENFRSAIPLPSDAKILRYASDHVTIQDGLYIEMGVCTGRTINFIAGLNPDKIIHGFDSFEGNPEEWNRKTWEGKDLKFKKGTFSFKKPNARPYTLHNVKLYVGLFDKTLSEFVKAMGQKAIAFLHVDCDIYKSTKEVFAHLGSLIVPGTIIVFDEFYHYPAFIEHEYKAFQEFMAVRKDLGYEYIAYNPVHEQVAIRITQGHG